MTATTSLDNTLADASSIGELSRVTGGKPRLVIGVTSDQTCLVLRGRLQALRLAGFDVTLVSAPGASLSRLA